RGAGARARRPPRRRAGPGRRPGPRGRPGPATPRPAAGGAAGDGAPASPAENRSEGGHFRSVRSHRGSDGEETPMSDRTSYPVGVPCWVDLVQPDFEAAAAFYTELFGWTFDVRTPPSAPATYAYALLDGRPVGGLGTPAPGEVVPDGWTQYVRVASTDDAAAAVEAAGGTVLNPPADVGPSGRVALCADPEGAQFGLWQPGTLAGATAVN